MKILKRFYLCFFAFFIFQPQDMHASTGITLSKRDKLYDVEMIKNHAWIAGYPGILFHSTDYGNSWELQKIETHEALFAIDFIDEKTGFTAGRTGTLFKTSDSGKTWTRLDSGVTEHLFDLKFTDELTGIAVGYFATILKTNDGGKTWNKHPLDENGGSEDVEEEEPSLNCIAFPDAFNGWIVGEFGKIYHTTDAGDTWVLQHSGTSFTLMGVFFMDIRNGYVVGSSGTVLSTKDGGNGWKPVACDTSSPLSTITGNGEQIFAAGQKGAFVQLRDNSFVSTFLSTYNWFSSLTFSDSDYGILIGGQGTILRTSDRGKSWSRVLNISQGGGE